MRPPQSDTRNGSPVLARWGFALLARGCSLGLPLAFRLPLLVRFVLGTV